jgi:8-hydroxy-5-deazaflavin:NADPH oxidoreductase
MAWPQQDLDHHAYPGSHRGRTPKPRCAITHSRRRLTWPTFRSVPTIDHASSRLPHPGNRPGHRDQWRRLDVLASEPFACICVAAVVLIADHLHDPSVRGGIVECRSPGLGLTIGVTTVGFIGSGRIGGTVARLAIAAGYNVVLSNSRVPQNLKDLVEELGRARAATPADAAAAGDLVVVSIPPRAYPVVPEKPLAGKPVLDTINYILQRDGRIPGLGGSLSSCEALQRRLAMAHVIKVLTNITSWHPASLARPAGAADRRRPADHGGRLGRKGSVDWVPRRDRVRHRGLRYAPRRPPAVSSLVPARSSRRTARSATSGVPRPTGRQYSPPSTPDGDWRPRDPVPVLTRPPGGGRCWCRCPGTR